MKTTMKTTIVLGLALALLGLGGSGCKRSDQSISDNRFLSVPLQDGLAIDLVKTPQGFWIGKTEVTQAQWEAVMGENPSQFKAADNPVERVSWNDCREFLEKLNGLPNVKKSGQTFRLPTKDEWEIACRAGSIGDYCILADGTEITKDTLDRVAWINDDSEWKTHGVEQKEPNAFGIYDMLGNVWEWTSTSNGKECIVRGGSLLSPSWYCAASVQYSFSPDYRNYHLGLRLCASQD